MYDRANIAADSVKGRYDNKIAQYNESMRQRLLKEQEIVYDMQAALETRQFEVWFQPQYNHSTKARIGAEALVRWRHPQKGLISPGDFIPLFEKNGFIYELDKFVWNEVCGYLRQWIDEGRNPLPVSVNISRYDVFRADLITVITGLMEKYKLPVDLLRLEITESAFSDSSQKIISVVKQFVEAGFTVEIDDFGSGYSSLNTLKDVPAQIIKLDMRFLDDNSDSDRGGNIVESVVRMAKWINMSVIAEGVETISQADYLRSIGCNYIQGYLYARPMPVDEYVEHCAGTEIEERLLTLDTVENLDNNSFWNPDSMDTLIFNSYVGGACIYEYHKGNIELIRATEKYAQVIGSAGMSVEDALKLNWEDHLEEKYHQKIIADLERSVATKEEVTGEYVFTDLPGCPHETYLRSTMRVIATEGNRYLVYCTNENITAQRQSEKREREVAYEMQLIMANVSCGICASVREKNGLFRIIFTNDRFYNMYGYTREQVTTELDGDIMRVVHRDDYEKTINSVKNLIRERGATSYEYRCIRRDGSVITVKCLNTVTAFEGISDTVLLSVIDDITEQSASEKKILSLAEQLSTIMQNINGGVTATVFDAGKVRLLFANSKHYEQLGYTKEQYDETYTGTPEMILPCDRDKAIAAMRSVAETHEPGTVEYRIKRADGEIRWFRSNISVIDYPGETRPVHLAVTSDVTEQLETELQNRKLTEQMKSIMDNVDVGIIAAVVTGNNAEYVFANDRYYSMLGYTKEQFIAEVPSPYSTVAPEDIGQIHDQTSKLSEVGQSTVLEYHAVRRDNTKRFFRAAVSVGRLAGIDRPVQLSIVRDITEEKETEQREKRANEQVQSIMRDIDSGLTATVLKNGKAEVLFSNEQFYRMRGYTKEQYRTEVNDFFGAVHPDDRERIRQQSLDIYKTNKTIRDEYRLITRDGSERWIRVSLSMTRFTGVGEPVILSVYSDITAEKQAELSRALAVEQMEAMMDDMPGGYARLRLGPDGSVKPEFINKGFCGIVGMSHEEAMRLYGNNSLAGVHPDDIPDAQKVISGLLMSRGSSQFRCRIRRVDGDYLWMNIVCRISEDEHGNLFLNSYYTDATEQVRSEEVQRALLDNLPGGAGVYEFKDGVMNLVYQNRSFWELVGLHKETYPDKTPMSAIHPDDIQVIMRELSEAIQQKRDISCDIRLRNLVSGYMPVHLSGRVVTYPDSRYLIYATFMPNDIIQQS